ncbi:MAG: CDC27 family protein [Bacteroidales bacterium]|jgi:tetratricopeptide (TPR) repeat protein|nr:CDC27 family protein [Bacteroidales bacterium]
MKAIDFSYFIERYNAGEMNEAEKHWFLKELEGNEKLRKEVEVRKRTDMVLKNHKVLQLRNKLSEIEKQRSARVPVKNRRKHLPMKYAAVFAGLILAGSFYVYNGRNLSNQEILDRFYTTYEVTSSSRSQQAMINSDYSTAIEFFYIHDYNNAALYFSKVLESDPKFIESTMLYGVSNYEERNYPEAEQSFSKVISNNDNLYLEDAQWYLALCYLNINEMTKAEDQLVIIKRSESIYSRNAARILRKMKK